MYSLEFNPYTNENKRCIESKSNIRKQHSQTDYVQHSFSFTYSDMAGNAFAQPIKAIMAWGSPRASRPQKFSYHSATHELPFPDEHTLEPGQVKIIDTLFNIRFHPFHGEIRPMTCLKGTKIDVFPEIFQPDFDENETIKICVTNNSKKPYTIPRGVPIVQLLITDHLQCAILWYGIRPPPKNDVFGGLKHTGNEPYLPKTYEWTFIRPGITHNDIQEEEEEEEEEKPSSEQKVKAEIPENKEIQTQTKAEDQPRQEYKTDQPSILTLSRQSRTIFSEA